MNKKTLEIRKLKREYITKSFEMIEELILSQAEYWKQIPKIIYISEGMSGYTSPGDILFKQRLYNIDYKLYINCETAEFENYEKTSLSKYSKKSIVNIDVDRLDAKLLCHNMNKDINEETHWDTGNFIPPSKFIKDSLYYGIDITHEDYSRHYYKSNKFSLNENEFNDLKETVTVLYTKDLLKGDKNG